MIGAFYQPVSVIVDTNTLHTLSKREVSAGLAEVIKYGAIFDVTFLNGLKSILMIWSVSSKMSWNIVFSVVAS